MWITDRDARDFKIRMDNAEMLIIAEILRDIRDNNSFSQDISDRINILSTKKQLCYTIEKEYFDIIYNALHYS